MPFSPKEKAAFTIALQTIDQAVARMENLVPHPTWTDLPGGYRAHRYVEHQAHQALVLKSVRLSSALRAGWVLLQNGLVLDAGATMRVLDELDTDIMFIAGPLVFQHPCEPRHDQYLAEFFQEEFDHPDPLQATQRRNRVSRRDIRAYVARTYNAGLPVSQVVAATETIDATFSGYVHGAAVHIMDLYDGHKFALPLQTTDRRLSDMKGQYVLYIHRAMMAVAVAAKAFGDNGPFELVYGAVRSVFTDDGDVRF
ncbi:hypothetical protein [Ciceribacter sp. L1K22]|uniref:hypothetical protein n=1 Tax=Ciceribacter sp. L1K22 TaxID=2820275 RepID=UPI001ABED211|nr:hypothetical protein [Ciceribacter sp. L1K22]MBO3759429.1 hypothetical protein [Ciceribacter sp. L1K22]